MRPIKKIYDNILETIGHTPMIRLNNVAKDIPGKVYAKVEYFNPGNSVKDRIALKMVEDAEEKGELKPGGTIIECTSGNTGFGLALAAIVKGYRLICTLSDKQSKEKIDVLRAMGAEIHGCPADVAPEHPDSYYSVAARLNKEIPNSFYPYQYDNMSNTQAHYEGTGPEIWEQTEGKITHFVTGVGTGGTISGSAKYLREQNPDIKVWGIDSYGSLFKKYHETGEVDMNEVYSYITEGIGEDLLPENVNFDLIDVFEKVTDKDGALMAREMARKEGLFLGYSCGSAMQGLRQLKHHLTEDSVTVVLFHDHGSRYINKIYNDDWMRDRGFLTNVESSAADLVKAHEELKLISAAPNDLVSNAIQKMQGYKISQIPVFEDGKNVGALDDSRLFQKIVNDPAVAEMQVSQLMEPPFPEVEAHEDLRSVATKINKDNSAVLVRLKNGHYHIITRQDVIAAMS